MTLQIQLWWCASLTLVINDWLFNETSFCIDWLYLFSKRTLSRECISLCINVPLAFIELGLCPLSFPHSVPRVECHLINSSNVDVIYGCKIIFFPGAGYFESTHSLMSWISHNVIANIMDNFYSVSSCRRISLFAFIIMTQQLLDEV